MRDLKSQKPLWIFESAASETKRSCDPESGRQLRFHRDLYTSLNLSYDDLAIAVGELQGSGSFLSPPGGRR